MGLIETTRIDTFILGGPADLHYSQMPAVLTRAGFTSVQLTGLPGQITAKCRSMKLWGTLTIHISPSPLAHPHATPSSHIYLRATANADNIYALGENPAAKLIRLFKEMLFFGSTPQR
jgi:hypothetical protein